MVTEATRAFPLETGGLLLGYDDPATAQVVIRQVVGPGPRAAHGLSRFFPDHDYHRRETARIYASSGRITSYLGDWHSHPGGGTALSPTDRRTLARIARAQTARAPRPIMIVLAGTPLPADISPLPYGDDAEWRVGVWQLLYSPSRWDAVLGRIRPVECEFRKIS